MRIISKEIKKLADKGKEIHSDIVYLMEELDTYNWHNSTKYLNADLNGLGMIIRFFYKEAEALQEELEEE